MPLGKQMACEFLACQPRRQWEDGLAGRPSFRGCQPEAHGIAGFREGVPVIRLPEILTCSSPVDALLQSSWPPHAGSGGRESPDTVALRT